MDLVKFKPQGNVLSYLCLRTAQGPPGELSRLQEFATQTQAEGANETELTEQGMV